MLKPFEIGGRPHWEVRFPAEVWPFFEDFRNALVIIWEHLGLPEPTEAQLKIACRLQYGADDVEWKVLTKEERTALLENSRSDIIRAFRGIGKSYVTAAFCAWKLARNPRDEKMLIVSATGTKSKAFVTQLRSLLETMELFRWMLDGDRERGMERRDQADRFDVAFSSLSQAPSVRAAGILGQVTGDRATTIVGDDIEIPANSATEDARAKIIGVCREFDSIAKTEHGRGDIVLLGTPQTEESVYNVLVKDHGYTSYTIPIMYPTSDKLGNYRLRRIDPVSGTESPVDILAYYLRSRMTAGTSRAGQVTDPKRFSELELAKLQGKGKAYFALQFMLDTSLSDAEKYPLKQKDLIVMAVNPTKGPISLAWGHHTDGTNRLTGIPNLGFTGDYLMRPLMVDPEWAAYEQTIMFLDPAGRGKDELAWVVLRTLHGIIYIQDVGGHIGDPQEGLAKAAAAARNHKVQTVVIEPNYGGGMFKTVFQTVLDKVWPGGACSVIDAEWASTQKEVRIIDTLEPVLASHRLVIDEAVLRRETGVSEENLAYSLVYQMTHITRDRGSLRHDDRLDALAGGVAYLMSTVAVNTQDAAKAHLDAEREAFIEAWLMRQEQVRTGKWRWAKGAADEEEVVYRTRIG